MFSISNKEKHDKKSTNFSSGLSKTGKPSYVLINFKLGKINLIKIGDLHFEEERLEEELEIVLRFERHLFLKQLINDSKNIIDKKYLHPQKETINSLRDHRMIENSRKSEKLNQKWIIKKCSAVDHIYILEFYAGRAVLKKLKYVRLRDGQFRIIYYSRIF